MSLDACAAQVARSDPDRFLSAMTAAPADRGTLMALYAFNLEVARAPWVTKEPMLAEMRLQWWADAIDEIYAGRPARRHEVVTPLADAIGAAGLPRAPFDALIAARRQDAYREPPADAAALWAYLDATSGGLMWLAARALGMPDDAEARVRLVGTAAGAANLLRALPAYRAAGRWPLVGEGEPAVRGLATGGLDCLSRARRGARLPRRPLAALRAGWLTGGILARAVREPGLALDGALEPSPAARRLRLMWLTASGGW